MKKEETSDLEDDLGISIECPNCLGTGKVFNGEDYEDCKLCNVNEDED